MFRSFIAHRKLFTVPCRGFSSFPKILGNSIMLSDTDPPKVRIPISPPDKKAGMIDISIEVNDTIDTFFQKIKEVGIKDVHLAEPSVPPTELMANIIHHHFEIVLNQKKFYVHPQLKHIMRPEDSKYIRQIMQDNPNVAPVNYVVLSQFTESILRNIKSDSIDKANFDEFVAQSLPYFNEKFKDSMKYLKKEVEELKNELDALEKQMQSLQDRSDRYATNVIYFGVFSVFTQLTGFASLIYYFYSWDVMEPITYLLGLFYSILGMRFFLKHREDFEFKTVEEIFRDSKFNQLCKKESFDMERLNFLREYVKTLQFQYDCLKHK